MFKKDVEFDGSCAFNSNRWNAIYIRYSNGSVVWYGYMKKGLLTTKNIGDMVAQGEYLGVVASSGNSSGPHLHFEEYQDNSYTKDKLIDPYAGPSNNWNANSWWLSQKPYKNPTINALTTNTANPDFRKLSKPICY
nr:M23 family metallopeptidase [Flavivirga aquatica]